MRPLNDKELGEVISQKIASAENVKTDHLWAGIESGLPSSSSGYMTGVVKSLLFALTFTSVLTVSDSSGFAMNSEMDISETETNLISEVSLNTEPMIAADIIVAREDQTKAVLPVGIAELELPEKIGAPDKVELHTNARVGTTYMEPIGIVPFQPSFEVPETIVPTEKVSNRKWLKFISISPYLSFHSMEPHAFDENYITSSTSGAIGLVNRTGVNVSYGYMKALTNRWSVSGSIGLDYYRTQFNYRIANYIDSEVTLENHRIDAGIAIGVGYRINSPIGEGTLQAEMWTRHQIHSFINASSYDPMILSYRISYLASFADIQVGPTLGSFINSNTNEMGRISPMQYGFTIRKQILKD